MQAQLPGDSQNNFAETKPHLFQVEREDTVSDSEPAALSDDEFFIKKAFQSSPAEGCDLLFRRYHRALCSHAVRYVYSKEIAEDIVSDVFCKFWKN